jgi:predicted nucleotidyltransferase
VNPERNFAMRRDQVMKVLREHRAQMNIFGIKSLAVFGSVARDEARPDSDVDILVEFDPPPTFQRYMDLKFYLEELLGCRVDLGTPDTLKPRIRTRVQSEALRVA